jgi:uncharacterized membrane protein YfcA
MDAVNGGRIFWKDRSRKLRRFAKVAFQQPVHEVYGSSVSITAFLALAAIAFTAALARGFSGFGGALIFVPLASAVLGPRTSVPLLLIVDGILTLGFIPNAWRLANRREVGVMALGAVVGVPLGAWFLASVDPTAIRWAIIIVAALMLMLLVSGWRYHRKPTATVTVAVGGLAGVFSGTAQMGGPPVVAYWLGSTIAAATARANILLYTAVSTVITVVTYLAAGLLTTSLFSLALVTGPAYGLGLLIGSRLFGLASETVFRRACYVLIAAAIALGLPVLDEVIR